MLPRLRRLKFLFITASLLTAIFIYFGHSYNRRKIIYGQFRYGEANANELEVIGKFGPTTTFAEDNCPNLKQDMINVHFILHSHEDPGWVKTAQKYFDEG